MQKQQSGPIGLRNHVLVDMKKAKRITQTASKSLLKECTNFTQWKKEELLKDTAAAEQELKSTTEETTFDGIKEWSANRANKVFRDTKNRQINKLDTFLYRRSSHLKEKMDEPFDI